MSIGLLGWDCEYRGLVCGIRIRRVWGRLKRFRLRLIGVGLEWVGYRRIKLIRIRLKWIGFRFLWIRLQRFGFRRFKFIRIRFEWVGFRFLWIGIEWVRSECSL